MCSGIHTIMMSCITILKQSDIIIGIDLGKNDYTNCMIIKRSFDGYKIIFL